jgi:hypothetical protein
MNTKLSVTILLSVFFILTLSTALRTSGTCDEIAHHIPVGYVLLSKWDLKMDTSQPPLSRYLVALPLKLFMKINMPDDKAVWRTDDRTKFGRDFFYKYNSDPKKMVFLARIPIMVIGVLCGLLLFIWAKALYGDRAGLLSLFLYCFSPVIIANAGLATTDMVATFFILLSVYAFWLFLNDPSFRKTALAGACIGLAQLSKYNAFLLYPVFLLLLIFEFPVRDRSKMKTLFARFFAVIFISLIVTWAGYGFDLQPVLKDAMRVEEKLEIAHNMKLDKILTQVPTPLGAHILGVLGVLKHSQQSNTTYFLGKWSDKGNCLYFLTAFVIKNPIPMLIFLLAGLFITFRSKINSGEKTILTAIAVFFITSSFSNLQIGIRHILPLFPLCFIIAGRSEVLLKKKILNIIIAALIIWYTLSSLVAWPDYIAYFNELIGGSKNGCKYLRDSNLDWGQDLPALSAYMAKNGVKEVALEYFGQADPLVYGIHYRKFNPDEFEKPGNSIYAVSAQYLEHVKWTKEYKPAALAGYSIFIYDFSKVSAK